MWPNRASNPELLAHESDALPTELRGPPNCIVFWNSIYPSALEKNWNVENGVRSCALMEIGQNYF